MNVNWKAWLHSLIAAALGGAASALGDIIVSPSSFPDTKAGWQHLGIVAACGAVIPVLALLRQSPRNVQQNAPTANAAPKALLLLLAVFLLPLGLNGCKPVNAPTAPIVDTIPGQLNQFDGQTWRFLYTAHEFAKTAVANADTLTQPQKDALNKFTASLNAANALYAAYHAGTATQAQMQAALNGVSQTEQQYQSSIAGAK